MTPRLWTGRYTRRLCSAWAGALLTVLGFASATPMMRLMGTLEEILADSALYLRIYSLGMIPRCSTTWVPISCVPSGDSKRPLYF